MRKTRPITSFVSLMAALAWAVPAEAAHNDWSVQIIPISGVTLGPESYTGNGGVITLTGGGGIYAVNTVFNGNNATGNGGAVYHGGSSMPNIGYTKSIVQGGSFNSNTAGLSGGAIYIDTNSALEITGGTGFTANAATTGDGGAIYNAGMLKIYGPGAAQFINNTASNFGGAIYNTGAMDIADANFANNTAAAGKGGAIYNSGAATLSLTGVTFGGNSASQGSGLYNEGDAVLNMVTSQDNDTFVNNGGSLAVNGGTFRNNTAAAILFENLSGDMAIGRYGSNPAAGRAKFEGNNLVVSHTSSGTLDISGADFKDNVLGGSVVASSAGRMAIYDSSFENGSAASGSAVSITGTEAEIRSSVFRGNKGASGAALSVSGAEDVVIENSVFRNNTASGDGGAIYYNGTGAGRLIIRGVGGGLTEFSGNKAVNQEVLGVNPDGKNDIYLASGSDLRLEIRDYGTILFKDGIEGGGSNAIYISGDADTNKDINDYIDKASNEIRGAVKFHRSDAGFDLSGFSVDLNNAMIDFADGAIYPSHIGSLYMHGSENRIAVDVHPSLGTGRADMLIFDGDVSGHAGLVLKIKGEDAIRKNGIAFADISGDSDSGADTSFKVEKTIGSKYRWRAEDAPRADSLWYVYTLGELKSEVLAYINAPSMVFRQSDTVFWNVKSRVAHDSAHPSYDYRRREADGSIWVAPTYYKGSFEDPAATDVEIVGGEAGIDAFVTKNSAFGLFMSRRIGDYSLSGDAIGADGGPSDVRVKSSLYGAYFTAAEEKGGFGVFAAAYAGSYDLTVTAEEGQEEFSGKAYGVDFEVDYAFRLSDEWSITTSTAASAHAVRFDGFTDSSAVSAEFGDIYKAAVTPSVKLGYSTKNDDGRITKAYVSGGYSESLVKNNSVDITSDGERAGYDAMSDGMRGTYAGLGFSTHMGASLLVGVDARKYFGEDDGIAASATARYQFGGESLTNGEWYDEFGHPEEPETMNFPRYFEETITDFRKNDVQLKDPAQLDRIIERIKKSEMDDYIVIVKGYISQLDQNYRSARSKQLILRRAQFVADQLALKGVSSSDIILDIKDAAEQIKTGDEKKDRKMNRRVTVTVVSRVKVKLLPEDEDKSISQLAAETADIINSAERAAGLETPGERAARELEGQRRKEAEAKEALGIAVPAPVSSASGSDDGGD